MRKLLPILVVVILIVSGIGTLAKYVEKTELNAENITNIVEVDLSTLKFVDGKNNYLEISIGNEELYLMNPGQPMIPRILQKYELPFGVTDIKVESKAYDIQDLKILKEIKPAPAPLPLTPREDFVIQSGKDYTVYNSDELYPHAWHSYHVGCGLNSKGEHVTHLTINIFPIRYSPATGKISTAEKFDIKITYENTNIDFFPTESVYDLVIISPSKFSSELERLVDHKNSFGMETIVKTTEEIYDEQYGCDKPEKIKYFIKDAIETWGISHVLLFGGLKSKIYAKPKDDINHGAKWWYVPVRYSNFQWDGGPGYNFTSGEPGYISDLYYADIYKEGGEFEDWDSNGNGVFAEWSGDDLRDEIDLYPDVTFGRLAVRNNKEAKDVIDKIINYEKQPADPSWFKRMISISGDGFLDQEDWDIQWDTSELSDGEYTIFAQSTNPDAEQGPIDEIHITLDKTVETNITFNHDDHLKEELQCGYPAPPIAEILTISNNNTLGNTDYTYTPTGREAYCND
ncbi:MAG: peptidase C25, partial [Thermoplasmatales archaeon]